MITDGPRHPEVADAPKPLWRRRERGRFSVILRSPTRQSRYGDGASAATKDLGFWN
jgi:hypothetical protein